MINLVSVYRAQRHLHLDFDETTSVNIPDLEFKLQQASGIVLGYLKIPIPEQTSPIEESERYTFWENNPEAIPFDVRAATLLVLGELWENREASGADCLSQAVRDLLHRHRDPAMA